MSCRQTVISRVSGKTFHTAEVSNLMVKFIWCCNFIHAYNVLWLLLLYLCQSILLSKRYFTMLVSFCFVFVTPPTLTGTVGFEMNIHWSLVVRYLVTPLNTISSSPQNPSIATTSAKINRAPWTSTIHDWMMRGLDLCRFCEGNHINPEPIIDIAMLCLKVEFPSPSVYLMALNYLSVSSFAIFFEL